MVESFLNWTTERRPGGVLVVSFRGGGGVGSKGKPISKRMRAVLHGALEGAGAAGLIVDWTDFEYRFGDWIGSVPLPAVQRLGIGRVCLVARGATAAALHPLWEMCGMDRIVPLFEEVGEAERFLAGPEQKSPGAGPGGSA